MVEAYFLYALFVVALIGFVIWGLDIHKVCITPRFMCKRCSALPYCARWHKNQRHITK